MSSGARGVSVVEFYAGGLALALSAEYIVDVVTEEPELHIAVTLGLQPVEDAIEGCTLLVAATQTEPRFRLHVDGPVRFSVLGPDHIIPLAPGLDLTGMRPIMGFARTESEPMVILLDGGRLRERVATEPA